jgi:hypothetical protein
MGVAHRVEHPAVTDGRQQERHGEFRAQHRRPQIAVRDRHALPGPEGHLGERGAVVRHRHLVLGAPVDVIEDQRGQAPPRTLAQVGDGHDAGRPNLTRESGV